MWHWSKSVFAVLWLRSPPSGSTAASTHFPDQICIFKFNLIHKGQTCHSIRSNQLMGSSQSQCSPLHTSLKLVSQWSRRPAQLLGNANDNDPTEGFRRLLRATARLGAGRSPAVQKQSVNQQFHASDTSLSPRQVWKPPAPPCRVKPSAVWAGTGLLQQPWAHSLQASETFLGITANVQTACLLGVGGKFVSVTDKAADRTRSEVRCSL